MKFDFDFRVLRGRPRPTNALAVPDTAIVEGESTRRSRRFPIAGIAVTVEAPTLCDEGWVVGGIDISVDGMGLALPREIPTRTYVLLSCHLDSHATFARLPARVLHSDTEGSGVRFEAWHEAERLMLLDYLLRRESGPAGS